MQGVIGSGICWWFSLKELNLSFYDIDERGIPTEICHPSSLQHLHLIENLFRSISVGINQLSMLRHLELGHCQELRQIPALSSSLRVLDVHECTRLETSSDIFSMQIPLLWVIQRRKIEPAFKWDCHTVQLPAYLFFLFSGLIVTLLVPLDC